MNKSTLLTKGKKMKKKKKKQTTDHTSNDRFNSF